MDTRTNLSERFGAVPVVSRGAQETTFFRDQQ